MKIKVNRVWVWNYKKAIAYWIVIFVGFGPFLLLIHSNQYEGAIIFGNDPFAYFISQALFIATFSVGFVYLVDWFMKRRRRTRSIPES